MKDPVGTRGIILSITPLREADIIATLLSEDFGKLRAVANGARASKRRFQGGVDIFDHAQFVIEFSRSKTTYQPQELVRLLRKEEVYPLERLSSSLWTLQLGALSLELTELLCEEGDPEGRKLYEPLSLFLTTLNTVSVSNSAEIQLASLNGFVQFAISLCMISGFPFEGQLANHYSAGLSATGAAAGLRAFLTDVNRHLHRSLGMTLRSLG